MDDMACMSYAHIDVLRPIYYATIQFNVYFITYVLANIVGAGGPVFNDAAHILTPYATSPSRYSTPRVAPRPRARFAAIMNRAPATSGETQPKSASAIVSPRWLNIRYRNSGSMTSFCLVFDAKPIRHNIKPETDMPITTIPNISNLITSLIAIGATIGHV